MPRYSPIWKKSRSLGYSLLGNNKEFSRGKKRNTRPGQHGSAKGKARHLSIYGLQNQEKQKLRYCYGLKKERQLRNIFIKAKKKPGDTAHNLMTILESRLVNLVFAGGLASTLAMARHLISYGHVLVDEKKITIPSFNVKVGKTITLKKTDKKQLIRVEHGNKIPAYINFDKEKITYLRFPLEEEWKEKGIDVSSVIEWYNKR